MFFFLSFHNVSVIMVSYDNYPRTCTVPWWIRSSAWMPSVPIRVVEPWMRALEWRAHPFLFAITKYVYLAPDFSVSYRGLDSADENVSNIS